MPKLRLAATAAFLALTLCACGVFPSARTHSPAAAGVQAARPSVLLVSLDGFHPDYLEWGVTPNLARLAEGGVRAEWMASSYPTLSFPNHYTIATGLRPDRHGIVHNTIHDPALGRDFSHRSRDANEDGRWWGGEPIWVAAEKAGLPTATMFWPGSEAEIGGVRPTRWMPFDGKLSIDARVDTVLGWMAEPAATRPRLATLYFEHLDKRSQDHGPDSPQTRASLAELDRAIGRLVTGLAGGDRVNLIVLSDHGMARTEPGQSLALEDMVPPTDAKAITDGESVGFQPLPGRTAAAERALLGAHEHYDCWRKGELPARWHYGRHPRVPAIVCQMHEGWDARSREALARRTRQGSGGSHGYDPTLESMRSLFIAHGPAFVPSTVLPAFDNVDIYPLLARLLGIEPAANDGDIQSLAPALRGQPDAAAR
ncbi:MAG: ectonucleotide pyrophosphatase/phosphodiesterase [Pseudomonadota bacterium]|nr:ectonucleotide pyrophosphatase/phosphodiesterase [Pseudomonadota bacterium]